METLDPELEPRYPELAEEISKMYDVDQGMRAKAHTDSSRYDAEVDRRNTERLQEIVAEVGWPTISKVGVKASHGAWLLVQHAEDADFQRQCLELMKDEPKGEVKPANIAYLEDRIKSFAGEPQIYGTQFYSNKDTGGKVRAYPIADPEHLDERRAALGLEPFAEYEKHMIEKYQK